MHNWSEKIQQALISQNIENIKKYSENDDYICEVLIKVGVFMTEMFDKYFMSTLTYTLPSIVSMINFGLMQYYVCVCDTHFEHYGEKYLAFKCK